MPQDEYWASARAHLDLAQCLQISARSTLVKLGQRIEELNIRQQRMAGEDARPSSDSASRTSCSR